MSEKCCACGELTHEDRLTKVSCGDKLCFECMCANFDVTKLGMGYFYIEADRPKVMKVVNGRPLYKRKKVFKRFKDPSKRGLYSVEIPPSKKHNYEQ